MVFKINGENLVASQFLSCPEAALLGIQLSTWLWLGLLCPPGSVVPDSGSLACPASPCFSSGTLCKLSLCFPGQSLAGDLRPCLVTICRARSLGTSCQ